MDESDTPRNISPLEAMAMCQSLTQSAGRRIPSRYKQRIRNLQQLSSGGAGGATAQTMIMLACWS